LKYRDRIGWVTLRLIKVLNVPIVIAYNTSERYVIGSLVQWEHPQISQRMGWLFSAENLISLKLGKIGPQLLLITNRQLRTRFRLVPKIDNLGWP